MRLDSKRNLLKHAAFLIEFSSSFTSHFPKIVAVFGKCDVKEEENSNH
jgi:hypothetical protein